MLSVAADVKAVIGLDQHAAISISNWIVGCTHPIKDCKEISCRRKVRFSSNGILLTNLLQKSGRLLLSIVFAIVRVIPQSALFFLKFKAFEMAEK